MIFARFVTMMAVAALFAAPSAAARAPSPGRSCSSFPAPGTIAPAGTQTPAGLVAEYGVLGQRQRPVDQLSPAQLKGLPASGIVMSGIRFLAVTPSGALVYVVPAEHHLTFRLAPDRCLRPAEQAIEHSLRPFLEREYTHHAVCLLALLYGRATSTCSAAPGTADPLVYGPGNPGFGLVPNGVPRVQLSFMSDPSLYIAVQRNFWVANVVWATGAAPCGLDWLDGWVVLRTVKSCRKIDTD